MAVAGWYIQIKHLQNRISSAGKAGIANLRPITVFRFDTGSALRGLEHPAPFHPQLPEFFIKWLTDKNDVVLDPFMGGGTTAEVALKMNRNYLGFEINNEYIKMTEERLKKNLPNKKIIDFS